MDHSTQSPENKTERRSEGEPCSPGLRKYVCLILPEICPAANGGEKRTKEPTGESAEVEGERRVMTGEGGEPPLFDPSQYPE